VIDSVRRDATDKGCHAAGERSYNCRNVSYPGVMSPAWALPPLVEPSAPLLAQEIKRYIRGATTRAAAVSRPSNWLICSLAGVVDVRGAQERTIAIPGARAIHLDEFRSGAAVPQIPFDRPFVIFCRAWRSLAGGRTDPDRGWTPGRAKPAGWGARVGPRRRPRPAQILS